MRCPHVQVQTVLANVRVRIPHVDALEFGNDRIDELKAAVGQLGGVVNAIPVLDRHRPLESQVTDGLLAKRYTEPSVHAILLFWVRILTRVVLGVTSRQMIVHVDRLSSHQTIFGIYNEVVVGIG